MPGGGHGSTDESARVFMVCPYATDRPGGVQNHTLGLARALRRRGVQVEVFAPGGGEGGCESLGPPTEFRDNGSVVATALRPGPALAMMGRIRRHPGALLHVHEPMLPVCLAAIAAARGPVVATFHRSARDHRWHHRFAPFVAWAGRRLDARIAVSEAAARSAAATLRARYQIVPNGIDVDAHPAPFAAPHDALRLLFVGRPEPRKGLPVLLEAFHRMRSRARLDLVGPHPRFTPAGVHAHGAVSDQRLRQLLRAADLVCVPSLRGESFGVVLLEAMASGTPVVASDLAGYRAVLPPGCGRLVPAGDAGALAETLDALAADPEARREMAERGRREATRYDWAAVLPDVLVVYGRARERYRRRGTGAGAVSR